MNRRLVTGLALLELILLPSLAWAVNVNFNATDLGTQKPVTTGTITFPGGGGPFKISENQIPIPADRTFFDFNYFDTNHWSQSGRCPVMGDPTNCVFAANPVYPFQDDAPPGGVILFNPFNTYQNLNNLPQRRFQVQDTAPTFSTSQVASRQQLGQNNNFQNYPLNFNVIGVEAVVGAPQLNFGPFQLNTGIGGQIGALSVEKMQTSRHDNAQENQFFNASGVASGIRVESVLSAPGMPIMGSGIPGARFTYTGTWGHATGTGVGRVDQGSLLSFGFVPNSQADTTVDIASNRLTAEALMTTFYGHGTIGLGGGWQQVSANTEIQESGTIPGNIPVNRVFRYLNRGTQGFGLVTVDGFVGSAFPMLGPLAGRVEAQIGPDNFGIFAKATWMFGAAGGPSIIERMQRNFLP